MVKKINLISCTVSEINGIFHGNFGKKTVSQGGKSLLTVVSKKSLNGTLYCMYFMSLQFKLSCYQSIKVVPLSEDSQATKIKGMLFEIHNPSSLRERST